MRSKWASPQGWLCALACLAMACGEPLEQQVETRSQPEASQGTVLLTLPAPTGPYPVGKLTVAQADPSRGGLFPGEPPQVRTLVWHFWYPSEPQPQAPRARYTSPQIFQAAGVPPEAALRIETHSAAYAPLSSAQASWPVVLFSHGYGANAEFYTSLLEELASHGYVVIGIEHTYIAGLTVFPNGRAIPIAEPQVPLERLAPLERIMAEDVSFVLDRLEQWKQYPGRFARGLDLGRVGHFGHSLGGGTSAQVVARDSRVRVGANMDGLVFNPLPAPLSKPFMLVLAEGSVEQLPEIAQLFNQLAGPGYKVLVEGTRHLDFSDAGLLAEVLELPAELEQELGTLEPERVVALTRAYLVALFNRHLRGEPAPLLEGPGSPFPEVQFERR